VSLVSRAGRAIQVDKPNKLKLMLMTLRAAVGLGVFVVPFAYETVQLIGALECSLDDRSGFFGIAVLAHSLRPCPGAGNMSVAAKRPAEPVRPAHW